MIKHSAKKGFSFGLTSGIITTLGLIVGLHAGTHSKLAVIGGVIIIAVADAFSDSLGIHISEETDKQLTQRQIWEATIYTFISKFFFALTFIIPILIFNFSLAIIISIIWGLLILGLLSYKISQWENIKAWKVVLEHLGIALTVIIITHYLGDLIARIFK